MGCVIHFFEIQPFIVTLAGMFLARGLCLVISTASIPISDPFWTSMAQAQISLRAGFLVDRRDRRRWSSLAVAFYVLHYTRFGRNVYAIGGNEQSALLMGLPVGRTKIAVYTISGFCSALGGTAVHLLHAVRRRRCTRSAWNSTRSPPSSSAARC